LVHIVLYIYIYVYIHLPPDNWVDVPPLIIVSKLSGKFIMKSYAFACFAASIICSRLIVGVPSSAMSSHPYAILSAIVASNNVGS
jgi:hypothetical protein